MSEFDKSSDYVAWQLHGKVGLANYDGKAAHVYQQQWKCKVDHAGLCRRKLVWHISEAGGAINAGRRNASGNLLLPIHCGTFTLS